MLPPTSSSNSIPKFKPLRKFSQSLNSRFSSTNSNEYNSNSSTKKKGHFEIRESRSSKNDYVPNHKIETGEETQEKDLEFEGLEEEELNNNDVRSSIDRGEESLFQRNDSSTSSNESYSFRIQHRYLPIISGLICPFSVLLEIPGLTERWYVRTEGFQVVETQANPILLDVGLAISMALGVAANIALITRFLEKRVRLSTLIAIFCLTVHDMINVATLIIFGVVHRFNDGFTYGDSFYLTTAATVASLVCNVTLIIDFVRIKDFTKNGSGLTMKQRSLVIAVMCLLCYIGLGSIVFSFLLHLTYINSLYFTICTITSVGFGDIVPSNLASKLFSFPYDVCGLVLLAFTIAVARETIIETFESSYRHRRGILASKARERKLEKKQRTKERRERREKELALLSSTSKEGNELNRTLTGGTSFTLINDGGGAPLSSRGGAGSRMSRELDFEEEKEIGISTGKAWLNRILRKYGWMKPLETLNPLVSNVNNNNGLTLNRSLTANSIVQEEKYVSFRKQIAREQRTEFRIKIGVAFTLFWLFWLIGAAVFHFTEGWNYFIALYFCFIFFTTIGYGDYSPQTPAGRAFFVAWSMLGIATMTLLLSVATESFSSRYKSSITEGKVKQTIRRVKAASISNSPISTRVSNAAKELLQIEGFEREDYIEPSSFPEKLNESIKAFHEHARYFMNGRTGDTPAGLRGLIDAADEFEDEFDRLHEGDELESGAHADTRHFLFMISYERTFDSLLDTSERLTEIFTNHAQELETMKALNHELRQTLLAASQASASQGDGEKNDFTTSSHHHQHSSPHSHQNHSPFPFTTDRPPGGDGDDEAEEDLIEEIDDTTNEEGDNIVSEDSAEACSPSSSILFATDTSSSALETYRKSNDLLEKINTSNLTPIKLPLSIPLSTTPISSTSSTSSPPLKSKIPSLNQFNFPPKNQTIFTSSPTSLNSSSFNTSSSQEDNLLLASPRTQTLTFVEPERRDSRIGVGINKRKSESSGSIT